MHLHNKRAPHEMGRGLRLARLLGFEVVQTQGYVLHHPGDSAHVSWCPRCQRGTFFSRGGSSPVSELREVTGTDAPPPVGYIDPFRSRLY